MNLPYKTTKEASNLLREGELVAFPTETVYGLGADATNDKAVAKIFEIKGRPQFNPLISHLPTAQHAFEFGAFSETAKQLASMLWPGPITFVVPRSNNTLFGQLCISTAPITYDQDSFGAILRLQQLTFIYALGDTRLGGAELTN